MKLKNTLLAIATILLSAGSVQAGIVVDNWDLDTTLATVEGGTLDRLLTGIDEMGFTAFAKQVTTGPIAAGSTATIQVVGFISSFTNTVVPPAGLGAITPPELNQTLAVTIGGITFDPWELTFVADINAVITSVLGDDLDFDHTSGTIRFYIDAITGGAGKADPDVASTFSDGTFVASMVDDGTGGGNFDLGELDGNDDGHFVVTAADALGNLAGVFTKGAYDFMKTVGSDAHTDSNFDADSDGDGLINTSFGALAPCGDTPGSFCAAEDGSAQLSQVPEPGTLGLLGLALVGLAARYRRRVA
jgi:hypothetical protein